MTTKPSSLPLRATNWKGDSDSMVTEVYIFSEEFVTSPLEDKQSRDEAKADWIEAKGMKVWGMLGRGRVEVYIGFMALDPCIAPKQQFQTGRRQH